MRKPVAAVAKGAILMVVCDDGTVWYTRTLGRNEEWIEAQRIPGTEPPRPGDSPADSAPEA
ncbi:MAG: hypothetical protein LJF06_14595 [Gemmatimonadetes bacterium]|nr:hypothetical protein [Gemmatimonadota bacterium]